jgi:four helix bundle protein
MQKVRTAMAFIQSFRDMDAWNVGMEVAVAAYKVAAQLPDIERYGLATQIRRAASSFPVNVAEGHSTGKDGRYLHHVRIALGSGGELTSPIELARRLGFVMDDDLEGVERELWREMQLLHGLARSVPESVAPLEA